MVRLRLLPVATLAVASLLPDCPWATADEVVSGEKPLGDEQNAGEIGQPNGGASDDEGGATPALTPEISDLNCLDAFNQARELSAFTAFTNGTETEPPLSAANTSDSSFWGNFCQALYPENTEESSKRERRLSAQGTPESRLTEFLNNLESPVGAWAYMAPQTSMVPSCATALDEWAAAAKSQDSLPPAYDKTSPFYTQLKNRSFVALYNPGEDPSLSCRMFKCPKAPETSGEGKPPALVEPNDKLRQEDESQHYPAGILCLTKPELKLNEAPFSTEQWERIKNGVKPSAGFLAVPSLVFMVVSVIGLAQL